MDQDKELLNFILQNSQMGITTIDMLKEIVEDSKFREQLETQYEEYNLIYQEVKTLIQKCGIDEKGLSTPEKIRTYLMINLQTLTDRSTSHIAEMMLVGSTMGIIDALRKIRQYKDASNDIVLLMKRLLKMEENNYEALKKFV